MYKAMERYARAPLRSLVEATEPASATVADSQEEPWSGVLHLEWTVDSLHPISIGTGRLERWTPVIEKKPKSLADYRPPARTHSKLRRGPAYFQEAEDEEVEVPEERVVEGIVLQAGRPLLPGSSLKGAVRQVFELLTPSCDSSDDGGRCAVNDDGPTYLCTACRLFGVSSLGGRIDFRDARWVGPGQSGKSTGLGLVKVPTAWPPREEHAPQGTYRIYELRGDVHNCPSYPRLHGQDRAEEVPVLAAYGIFRSQIHLRKLSFEEQSILLQSLGFGKRPGLRLGGKKFHGEGALSVKIVEALKWSPATGMNPEPDLGKWLTDRLNFAKADSHRLAQWQKLHEIWSRTAPLPGGV